MREESSGRVIYCRPKRAISATRVKAEAALEELKGLYLVDMHRAFGFQCLSFEEQPVTPDQDRTFVRVAAIHMAGRWRITDRAGFTLCNGHFGPGKARRDHHASTFYARLDENPLRVEWVTVAPNGTLTVGFTDGVLLDKPSSPKCHRFREEWRYLPIEEDRPHLVLDWRGLDWSS